MHSNACLKACLYKGFICVKDGALYYRSLVLVFQPVLIKKYLTQFLLGLCASFFSLFTPYMEAVYAH